MKYGEPMDRLKRFWGQSPQLLSIGSSLAQTTAQMFQLHLSARLALKKVNRRTLENIET
jgi:predicted PP-loop superfamily ATPase